MTDDQLINASREGDENAFRQLSKRYEFRVAANETARTITKARGNTAHRRRLNRIFDFVN